MASPFPNDFRYGRFLRGIRRRLELTLEAVASAAGMSATYLSKIEREELPPPTLVKRKALASVLGFTSEMMSMELTDLEKAAHRLALSVGHYPTCVFGPCTCGASQNTAEALTDFWREYHKKEAQVVENVPTESS